MPHFKSIIFYQNRPNIKLVKKKIQNFRAVGAPRPDPRNSLPLLQFFGYAPESNCAFAALVSVPPEFSLMSRLKSI